MEWNVLEYETNADYVSEHGKDVVTLLAPTPNERILDLGCGSGALAGLIALSGCRVLGVDSSPEMIAATQKRGIDADVMDGQNMVYEAEFDAVFSNAALHWMKQSEQVISNVYKALKPGGRFCGEMGGQGNVQTIIDEIYNQLRRLGLDGDKYNPWYFPGKKAYQSQLEAAGFTVDFIDEFPRLTKLPTNVGGWLETFAKPFLRDVPEREQQAIIQKIEENLAAALKNQTNEWFSDYVRLRFLAYKK